MNCVHLCLIFVDFRTTLMRTMSQCFKFLEFARENKVEVKYHGRLKNDASHYCGLCEVRNIDFF